MTRVNIGKVNIQRYGDYHELLATFRLSLLLGDRFSKEENK